MSNAYTYKDVKKEDFAGPHDTYPINTKGRFRAAKDWIDHLPKSKQAAVRAKMMKIAKRKGYTS